MEEDESKMPQPKYSISPDEAADLERRFGVHEPMTAEQKYRATQILAGAGWLGENLMEKCPRSRELSLALTKLEEATAWAIRAISRNEPR